MKKVIIIVAIVAIVIGIIILIKPKEDIEKILSKYETVESDGYIEDGGYIVSKKTAQGYRYGYVNYKGKLLLNLEYNAIIRVQNLGNKDKVYLIASKNGRYGVNINDKTIINYEYQFIDCNNNEVFVLNKNDRYGVANTKGEIIIKPQKNYIEAKGMYIYINDDERSYVCDINGKEVQLDFNVTINKTENDKYYIKTTYKDEDYKYQISDQYGNAIGEKEYSYLQYVFDDYFIAGNEDRKQGLINEKGETKIDFNYTLIQRVRNTNVIRTLNIETNETEVYSSKLEKICNMKNATIENKNEEIIIYNKDNEIKLDTNGNIKN
ncbi:MAG: hypothetical protein HFJ48_04160 [Clostridia bacterium]|nr:hypothetical protein [Clostridia bacterium]